MCESQGVCKLVRLSDEIHLHFGIKGTLVLSLDHLGKELLGNLLVYLKILLLKLFKEELLVLVKQLCEVLWLLEVGYKLHGINQSLHFGCKLVLELNDFVLVEHEELGLESLGN